MSKVVPDVRVYTLLDPEQCRSPDLAAVAKASARGGATLVQLRCKQDSTRVFLQRAMELHTVLASYGIPLLINDRVDIALAAGVAGVHLGQDDMPVAKARQLLGPQAIIGLTVRSLQEARLAPLSEIDYLSIGGVFATASKQQSQLPIRLQGLRELVAEIRQRSSLPLCAISGIHHRNAQDVLDCGVDGLAVISAVSAAADPEAATLELRRIIAASNNRRTA